MNQTRAGPFQKRGEWVSFPVMKAATYYAVLLALVLMDIVFSSNTIELINYRIN